MIHYVPFTIAVPGRTATEFDRWAEHAGVNRSELARLMLDDFMRRIHRRGRRQLREDLRERRGPLLLRN